MRNILKRITATLAITLTIALVTIVTCNANKSIEANNQSQIITQEQLPVDTSTENSTSLEEGQLFVRGGCCSYHGGVDGCDYASGMLRCNDGTLSPSCTCGW